MAQAEWLELDDDRLVLPAIQNVPAGKKKKTDANKYLQFPSQRIKSVSTQKMKNSPAYYASPSSSPPTPSSPLPISLGPGSLNYDFSSSPSPTPPSLFSPPSSPHHHTSSDADTLPLLNHNHIHLSSIPRHPPPSSFSLDLRLQDSPRSRSPPQINNTTTSSCLKDLLEWLVLRCCRNCPLPI